MDALRLLMRQHDRVEGLLVDLTQVSAGGGPGLEVALREFARELRRHFELEEVHFYAEVSDRLILVEASRFLDEHRRLLELLDNLEREPGQPSFAERLEQLHDLLVRHVSDEEIDLFPEVKRRFDVDELDALGDRLERALAGPVALPEETLGPGL